MRIEANEPCPYPADPLLARHARAMNDIGEWAWIVDRDWRVVYMSDEQRLSNGAGAGMVPVIIGAHIFSREVIDLAAEYRMGPKQFYVWREFFQAVGGMALSDGGAHAREALRQVIDLRLIDDLDAATPIETDVVTHVQSSIGIQSKTTVHGKAVRIRDSSGAVRGVSLVFKPGAGMNTLAAMAFERDPAHVARVHAVARAERRPTAILFGDLVGSSALSRTLSTGNYFSLVRRIVQTTDRAIVEAGGVVGRHVGDGVVAFFPAESFESESAAACACIASAHTIRDGMTDVAARSGLVADDLILRFGLHWGSTPYMGNISTLARAEVTAVGDEINEAARIEVCATDGRILASKPLVERLSDTDAERLGIDLDRVTYTQLAALETATDKARRDAPALAVCEL